MREAARDAAWSVYVDTMDGSAARACEQSGRHTRHIEMAGHAIALHFAGAAIAERLYPALAHLEVNPDARAELAITIFDAKAAGAAIAIPPFRSRDVMHGQLAESFGKRGFAAIEESTFGLSVLDRVRNRGWFQVPDTGAIPAFETAFPLRTLFNAWLNERGLQLVHAGAVGTEHGAVLLPGAGGAGKSNTCLACLDAGMRYAGDDYVLLGAAPSPTVFGIFASAKLYAADLPRFPRLQRAIAHVAADAADKSVLLLQRHTPAALARSMPLVAILLPRVTGRVETRVVPVSRARSLATMAPSTLFQLAGAREREFAAMARIAAKLPCFALELGTDRAQIPRVIERVIRDLAPPLDCVGAAAS